MGVGKIKGRIANGEVWDFEMYEACTSVFVRQKKGKEAPPLCASESFASTFKFAAPRSGAPCGGREWLIAREIMRLKGSRQTTAGNRRSLEKRMGEGTTSSPPPSYDSHPIHREQSGEGFLSSEEGQRTSSDNLRRQSYSTNPRISPNSSAHDNSSSISSSSSLSSSSSTPSFLVSGTTGYSLRSAMFPFHVLAFCMVIGPKMKSLAARLEEKYSKKEDYASPFRTTHFRTSHVSHFSSTTSNQGKGRTETRERMRDVIINVSPLPKSLCPFTLPGVVLRVASKTEIKAFAAIDEVLGDLWPFIGGNPLHVS